MLVMRLDFGSPNVVQAGEIPDVVSRGSWAQPGKSLYVSRLVKGIVRAAQRARRPLLPGSSLMLLPSADQNSTDSSSRVLLQTLIAAAIRPL